MATLIGIVSKVVGQVFAVSTQGGRRALVEGDRLYVGEQLVTGAEGAIAVHLQNGQELTLGRDSHLQVTSQMLAQPAPQVVAPDAVTLSKIQLAGVARLQEIIAAAGDPTQVAEASAAGPTALGITEAKGSGHRFVLLEEVAARVDPIIGFPTAGFNGIPEFVPERINAAPPTPDNGVAPAPNNQVALSGLSMQGSELTFNEANLAQGSTSNPAALTQGGTFSVVAPDGVFNLSVGGINWVTAGVVAASPQSVTTAMGNTLTITGFNPATGVVSYSYTLVGHEKHFAGGAANNLSEHFTVVASDSNGDSATHSLVINITDDVPLAVNDTHVSTASESLPTLTGNVLTNDVQGADRVTSGPIPPGTFTGTYGTLVLAADGTYSYMLHTTDPAFLALKGGGNATETFTYRLTDSDGDTSTANLVLNVHNNDDPVLLNGLDVNGGELAVFENNLSLGSSPEAAALTQSGSFTVSSLDGLQTLSVGGINVVSGGVALGFPQSVTTALGNTLIITDYNAGTGVVDYSYTLTGNKAHPTANGANRLSEHFTVSATDVDGSLVSAALDVNVVDDVPTAADDSHAGIASESLPTLTGTVLANDTQGADGVPGGPVTAGTFTGTYGTLVLAAQGAYTYTLNTSDADFNALHGNGRGTENFAYSLTDSDGDRSTANLVLNVYNNPVRLNGLGVQGGELTVLENNLSFGSAPNATALVQSGSFTVSALDGVQTLSVGGINAAMGGVAASFPQSVTTTLGNTLTVTGYNPATGKVSYRYTLVDHQTHPSGNAANSMAEHFNVVAGDGYGNTASGVIDVNIVDDLPTARPDTGTVGEGAMISFSVLGNDITGADAALAVIGVRAGSNTATSAIGGLGNNINGAYGYLTLDGAGNAVYHNHPNSVSSAGATDVFTYTLRDGDGDESTTTLTINVTDSGLKAMPDQDVTVYEKALDLSKDGLDLVPGAVVGSAPGDTGETASGTLVGSATGGSGAITYTLVGSATGAHGQILINPDGSYTYTLTSAAKTSPNANNGPNVLSDSFTYQATDALGNTATSTLKVNIVDDVPTAVASERSVTAVEMDSNLLLVIDVSGSMADPSGVPGLSRLGLAKQAIGALLDKYDGLGSIKVQIVTFSNTATDQTPVWVDIATAKTIIASLSAGGGTNYDAALAAMKLAFDTVGKLASAQNIGYFFSDGEPSAGQDIDAADEAMLKDFLSLNTIRNYAIGLGSGVKSASLDPMAYEGDTGTSTKAVVVSNLTQLNSVLSGTVQGAPVTGNLWGEGGMPGADGGFVKVIVVDGNTYTYDPKGNGSQGSLTSSGQGNSGTFNTMNNSISIETHNGGTLVINLDTADFTYTSHKATDVLITESISVTFSDHDGDLTSATLVVRVNPNSPPVAVDDHVITNLLSGTLVVPGELLLANDSDADGKTLTATPTTFNTGWVAKGADFTAATQQTLGFAGTDNSAANQALTVARSAFMVNTTAMTAVLVVSGYLGVITTANANTEDRITVGLKQGETLNLEHNLTVGHIRMEYSFNGGAFTPIADGATFTAAADGNYQIHLVNVADTPGGDRGAENYQLTMTVNYSGASHSTADYRGFYSVNDDHGGSSNASVTIRYQDGHTLTGTPDDDVLVAGPGDNLLNGGDGNDVLAAGSGNNSLHGGNGDDLLFSGLGNDVLDGGPGNDTASFAHAHTGVTVDLSLLTAQNTLGAGTDTLTSIENLLGSNFNDTLTGDNSHNMINGGLGNDVLNGGGGDDSLIGGKGNNTLSGGAGADTFQWLDGNSGDDVVTDFTRGTDKLDLSQLLQGENATAASLDDYLYFKVTGIGASQVTTIDVSTLAGATPNQSIALAGVNLASHYGVTPGADGVISGGADTAIIINGMLNDYSLKVDTV